MTLEPHDAVDRLAGVFATLSSESRNTPLDADGLRTEAKRALGVETIDDGSLTVILKTVLTIAVRDAEHTGEPPALCGFIRGLRVGEKLGYAKATEEGAHE